jgi:DNA modification methylase
MVSAAARCGGSELTEVRTVIYSLDEWLDAGKPLDVIINGDCLEVLPHIEDKSIDLVLTDPPYNIKIDDWDNIKHYEEFIRNISRESHRVLKRNGTLYFWGDFSRIFK